MIEKNYIMIDNIEEVVNNPEYISKFILKHERENLPRLKNNKKYYLGEHEIKNRNFSDWTKPNNKIANPYANYITNMYVGYFLGKPVKYTSTDEKLYEKLIEVFKDNYEESHNSLIGKDASIYGVAYELLYTDEEGEVKFVKLNPEEIIPIYDNSINLNIIGAIRYYSTIDYLNNEKIKKAELYTDKNIYYYEDKDGFELKEVKEHFFLKVPVNVFYNVEEEYGDFELVQPLIDAYDKLSSDQVNESDSFADAYMVFKGINMEDMQDDTIIDEEGNVTVVKKNVFANIKQNKIIGVPEGGDVQWLIKQGNTANVESQKKTINDDIHKFTFTPDLSTENLGSISGVSIQYRFKILEQNVGNKERLFKQSLINRINMIVNFYNLKNKLNVNYKDVNITFTRNIPENIQEVASLVQSLTGIMSQESLLEMLTDNPKEEMEKIKKEQEVDYEF